MNESRPPAPEISRDAVRHALRAWASLQELGGHPLAELASVRARQQAEHYSATPAGRGLALQGVLRAAIEALRPGAEAPNWLEKRWRPYIVLIEQYIYGRGPDWIADTLHVSRRTYYGEQEQALNAVADVLLGWEEDLRRQQAQAERSSAQPPAEEDGRQVPFLAPPHPAHGLVGRADSLRTLTARLLEPPSPLIALHGLPGAGKTALAVELAHDPQILAHFSGGILWAGLGRQPDALALLGTWAAALGVPASEIASSGDAAARAQLVRAAIGMRRMLLVIDDAWQIDAALLFKLGGPGCAHILTTRIPGIALDFAGAGVVQAAELDLADGLELLEQIVPHVVAAEPEEARSLVRATGGLPLALILIGRHLRQRSHGRQARRLRETLADLQAAQTRLRLSQPQSPLEAHPALPPGASISLQAIIGVSDAALSQPERQALRDLALFPPKPNTFAEPAALATAAIPGGLLDVLVDYGLLECSGAERYTLHQTIADYARAMSADPAAVGRLVAYFVGYAEQHGANPDQLAAERENLIAAINYARAADLRAEFGRGVHALAPLLMLNGLYALLGEWLTPALDWLDPDDDERRYDLIYKRDYVHTVLGKHQERPRDLAELHRLARELNDERKRMEALLRQASFDFWSCDYPAVIAGAQEAVAIAQAGGLVAGEIDARLAWGRALWRQADYAGACAHYRQGLELAQAANLPHLAADALRAWGVAASAHSDHEQAHLCHEQAYRIYRELGDRRGEGYALMNLAIVAIHQLDYPGAQAYFEQSLLLNRELGNQRNIAATLINLGKLTRLRGELDQAQAYFDQALPLARTLKLRDYAATALNELGMVALHFADHGRARALIEQAVAIYHDIGNRLEEQRSLLTLGLALQRAGQAAAHQTIEQALRQLQELDDRAGQADGWLYLGHGLAAAERWSEAAAAYQAAVDLYRAMKQFDQAVDPLAGLARMALAAGQPAQAMAFAEEILARMQVNPALALTADPFMIYLTCYQVLLAAGDSRATTILRAGQALLQSWIERIGDSQQRDAFSMVAGRRELQQAGS
jgi:tetratricopeptide (TPR) repeat protein